MTPSWQLSADTGGTFTDCYALNPEGEESRCKVLSIGCLRVRIEAVVSSTQLRLSGDWQAGDALLNGWTVDRTGSCGPGRVITGWQAETREVTLDAPAPEDWQPGSLLDLRTGEEAPVLGARLLTGTALNVPFPLMTMRVATTRATNALLERKVSRVALFITEGFGDLTIIGDQRRADLFALQHQPRPQFHETTVEVPGRLTALGEELHPLDEARVLAEARRLRDAGIHHAAAALLHSHANPAHEQRMAALLNEAGFEHVSLSSELAPFVKLLPRAQSAIANACLSGPVQSFIEGVSAPLGDTPLHLMTSAGGLETADRIRPKDMLLSGPAGGAIGAANAARRLGIAHLLTLDMGGTSTDVARIEEGRPGYRFTQHIEGMSLLAPCVAIETVAAGGGSICRWTAQGLAVGPHSAGSNPGPACYGRGGPLTITDVNLLLGRFDPTRAPIPLDRTAAEQRLAEHQQTMAADASAPSLTREALLQALLDLAIEHMAGAIRRISVAEGCDPTGYALLAFGGAGPQHACAVAERLGIQTIIVPRHAGILSAVGLSEARREVMLERQILQPLADAHPQIQRWIDDLVQGSALPDGEPSHLAELRLRGQDTPLQVSFTTSDELPGAWSVAYQRLFGYAPPADRVVELVSLRVVVREREESNVADSVIAWQEMPASPPATQMQVVQDAFSTLIVEPGWSLREVPEFGFVLQTAKMVSALAESSEPPAAEAAATMKQAVSTDLMRHRFHSLVDDMGALLKRTAISTNIRERLDFSCALLDASGTLIASAPHIPVHLGALGVCVRESVGLRAKSVETEGASDDASSRSATEYSSSAPFALGSTPLRPGDTLITNHPAFGGSHLPDVTLITPVFDAAETLLGYVASRAHHAEIGGRTPGSMPADATCLAEEGVVIAPRHLVREGVALFDDMAALLRDAPYPTRNPADNLADLHAQLAANRLGVQRLLELAAQNDVPGAMAGILRQSARAMEQRIAHIPAAEATEVLDDGCVIRLKLLPNNDSQATPSLTIDFTGTSPTHPQNLNATRAIVSSAVLYTLRLLLQEDLPLNEGLMRPVRLVLPEGSLLNPVFSGDALHDPAVVGGNVEVSQRVVAALVKALQLQAGSQGTMNNFLFGNERFGYYETIAGGAGAGIGYAGASALHTHMTNTAITDPEIIEQRYPVRLHRFAVRRGSGGQGRWPGGDGVVRELEFLEPLTVSLLTQHRVHGPEGLQGGQSGQLGRQTLIHQNESRVLPSSMSLKVEPGDRLILETPGGGGAG